MQTAGRLVVTDEGYEDAVELLHVGEKLFVLVADPDLDISDERDSATVVVASESGEKESVKLHETLSHSGIFTGSFELKAREKPTAANFSDIDKEIECFFGADDFDFKPKTTCHGSAPFKFLKPLGVCCKTEGSILTKACRLSRQILKFRVEIGGVLGQPCQVLRSPQLPDQSGCVPGCATGQ